MQLPVAASRIDRARELPTRAPNLVGAEPFGNQLDDDIGERADAGQEQDDETPGREAPGLGGMNDQRHVDEGYKNSNIHVQERRSVGSVHPRLRVCILKDGPGERLAPGR